MIRQFELVEKVKSYDPYTNEILLNKAYVFAMKVHGNQKRASGDPYFSHPLEVAGILTELKLDWKSIIVGLLHDTVEDTDVTLTQIEKLFGQEIAKLVNGVTKLSKIENKCIKKTQAENFRKLLLAMSEDIRVLLIKLADRLHNMRTLHHIKSVEKQKRIAKETIDIFAPLAGRIGLQSLKVELENLAFSFLNSDALETIKARLQFLHHQGQDEIKYIKKTLEQILENAGIRVEISGRQKSPYSIWEKMQTKNIPFENLSDIIAFRILAETTEDCYKILGVIHSSYASVAGRFKDYISMPKPNNYRSIHTTVLMPPYQRVEIQIRTKEMHREAELGVAAYWNYKETDPLKKKDSSGYKWLRSLLDILNQAEDPDQFLEHTKMEMYSDQVFCFTPNGDLISLAKGACSIDFAYAVHSDIGNQCTGAKINGKLMPLRTPLNNGDQVEVITSSNQEPLPIWEKFAISGKALAHIRQFIKNKERSQYLDLGKSLLLTKSLNLKIPFREEDLEKNLLAFNGASIQEIYISVGKGSLCPEKALKILYPKNNNSPSSNRASSVYNGIKINDPSVIGGIITGLAVHFAKCCHPIPGDIIQGSVSSGKGVVIHRKNCKNLDQFSSTPSKLLNLDWGTKSKDNRKYLARLNVSMENRPGTLGTLSTFIGKLQANIFNLNLVSQSHDFVDLTMDIDVHDLQELDNIIAHINTLKIVSSVSRE